MRSVQLVIQRLSFLQERLVITMAGLVVDAERIQLKGPVNQRHVLDLDDCRRRRAELLALGIAVVIVLAVHKRLLLLARRERGRVRPVVVVVHFVVVAPFGRRGRRVGSRWPWRRGSPCCCRRTRVQHQSLGGWPPRLASPGPLSSSSQPTESEYTCDNEHRRRRTGTDSGYAGGR